MNIKAIINGLCETKIENLHHAIVLFEEPLGHKVASRDAFFREGVELNLWLKELKDQYASLGIPYATWVNGQFTNHGMSVEESEDGEDAESLPFKYFVAYNYQKGSETGTGSCFLRRNHRIDSEAEVLAAQECIKRLGGSDAVGLLNWIELKG